MTDWNNIQEAQKEITRWASQQFPHRTDFQALTKLVLNEIPELLTHKKEHGMTGIGLELADAFILLLDLGSIWGVDVAEAIRAKMTINYGRRWSIGEGGLMQHIPTEDDSHVPTAK